MAVPRLCCYESIVWKWLLTALLVVIQYWIRLLCKLLIMEVYYCHNLMKKYSHYHVITCKYYVITWNICKNVVNSCCRDCWVIHLLIVLVAWNSTYQIAGVTCHLSLSHASLITLTWVYALLIILFYFCQSYVSVSCFCHVSPMLQLSYLFKVLTQE